MILPECVADRLGKDYAEIYGRMKAAGLIEKYIIPHYDVNPGARKHLCSNLKISQLRYNCQK